MLTTLICLCLLSVPPSFHSPDKIPLHSLIFSFYLYWVHPQVCFPHSGKVAASSRNWGLMPPPWHSQTGSHIPQKDWFSQDLGTLNRPLWTQESSELNSWHKGDGVPWSGDQPVPWSGLLQAGLSPGAPSKTQGSHTVHVRGSPKGHWAATWKGQEEKWVSKERPQQPANPICFTTTISQLPESQIGHTSVWPNYWWMHTYIIT